MYVHCVECVCVCVCVCCFVRCPISLFCGTYDMATEKPRIYEDGAVIHESESESEIQMLLHVFPLTMEKILA